MTSHLNPIRRLGVGTAHERIFVGTPPTIYTGTAQARVVTTIRPHCSKECRYMIGSQTRGMIAAFLTCLVTLDWPKPAWECRAIQRRIGPKLQPRARVTSHDPERLSHNSDCWGTIRWNFAVQGVCGMSHDQNTILPVGATNNRTRL